MTRLVALATASAMALAAGAHAQNVAREDTVIFDLDRTINDPGNFNWFTDGTGVRRMHGGHQVMWEPLFILNYETGDLEPWLATGFEQSEDLRKVTITLREGVTWSDGEAFDAEDVVFTVNLAIENEEIAAREAATIRAQVESVEAVDPQTVRFTLTEANPRFVVENFGIRIFGSFLIMPQHVWAGEDPATFTFPEPIGTGPYTFTSSATNRAIWDRNDEWWGAQTGFAELPEPLRVVFLETGGEESRAQLVASNQMDAGQAVTVGTFEAMIRQNPAIISWFPDYPYAASDPCARQLEINTTVAPWDDPAMRQAIAHIIDREQIVNVAYEGTTIPSRTMFPEFGSMEPFIQAVVEAGHDLPASPDVEAADALLQEAGWSKNDSGMYEMDGEPLEVAIHVNSASAEYTRTIDVIVEQLNRAGVAARAVPVENGVFWGEVLPFGSYEMSYSWLSCGSVNEPWSSMGRYTVTDVVPVGERSPGFNNTARWDSDGAEAYSQIVNEMATMPIDSPDLPGMVGDAYQYLDEGNPFIPLVQAAKLIPYNTTYWTGWPTSENNYNHPFFWWNSAHQIIHNLERAE